MSKIIAIKQYKPNQKKFYINWMLHDRCTYNCSYCPPSNKAGTDAWLKIDFSKQFVDKLEARLRQQDKNDVTVHFTGGEATVWPNFIELVDHIYSKGWKITLSTNGSRSLNWWIDNHHKFYSVSISYHSEHADHDDFINKIKTISTQRHNLSLWLEVMMNPRQWEDCVRIVETLKVLEPVIQFNVMPLQRNFGLQPLDIPTYTVEQLNYIKQIEIFRKEWWRKNGHLPEYQQPNPKNIDHPLTVHEDRSEKPLDTTNLILNGKVNFYGWRCDIGLEQIFINSQGIVYGGTCLQGKRIGKIERPEKLDWPNESTECKSVWCGCVPDIKTSKRSPNYLLS